MINVYIILKGIYSVVTWNKDFFGICFYNSLSLSFTLSLSLSLMRDFVLPPKKLLLSFARDIVIDQKLYISFERKNSLPLYGIEIFGVSIVVLVWDTLL